MSLPIAHILQSAKKQKGKPCKMDLPLLKNDIPNNLEPQKPVIHSSKSKVCIIKT
jgi:hypothetical protein